MGPSKRNPIPAEFCRQFIGGSGLAARLLWDDLIQGRDPLDPQSPLLWATGPLTGSGSPTPGRSVVCGRSPQTGLWGESNIGGHVGAELRRAGFDALWISGRANHPVYLWIHDGQAGLRPADALWSRVDPYQTQEAIRSELGEPLAKVAAIGKAGENGVPYAVILSDNGRVAGRTGMGALMGSKNLKAIAVRGTQRLSFARQEEFARLRLEANRALKDGNMTAVLNQTGTSGSAEYLEILGDMPKKYWTGETFEGAGRISGSAMAESILAGTSGCHGCVICCGREVSIPDGPYATSGKVKGPEYETICSFGSQLLVDDLAQVTALGGLCDRLGMDTISAGNTLALAYLLYERGLLHQEDTGGLELRWGDASPCFELLEQAAGRRGFGALLAEGSLALATRCGVPELAAQVNGLEVPMHDPRAASGMALSYATSPRGACHNQSDFFLVEMGGTLEEIGIPMTDHFGAEGKAALVARHQHWRTVCNSLPICFFAVVSPTDMVGLLNAATGGEYDLASMLKTGEHAWNLKRAINLRLGLTRESEKLPALLLEPLPNSGQEGHVPDMDTLLAEYYAASGWDPASGAPTAQKLESLGIGFAAT